jgi:hypothetical protein
MTASQSSGRPEFLVCHDHGQGGLWAIVRAVSAEQVHQRFPGLQVFRDPSAVLDGDAVAAIRRGAATAIEDPAVGWLADDARDIC